MSKINGNLLFPDPVQENDAVNLKYLNEKIDELKALLSSAIVEFRNFNNKPIKTSELTNDSEFISKKEMKEIQKNILNKIIDLI